jgi:hypothetical protein
MEINKAIEKMMYKFKRLFRNRKYDVYCPYCTSCGETGCCSPTSCVNHKKGFYCQINQDALKVSYWTLNEFWNNYFEEQSKKEDYNKLIVWTRRQLLKEVEDALSEIYTKNYGEQREYRMSLPKRQSFLEKVTITEKAKKWFNDYFLHIVVVLIFIGFISVLISALITKYK